MVVQHQFLGDFQPACPVNHPSVNLADPVPAICLLDKSAVLLDDSIAVREGLGGAQLPAQVGVRLTREAAAPADRSCCEIGSPRSCRSREAPVPNGTVRRSSGNRASEWWCSSVTVSGLLSTSQCTMLASWHRPPPTPERKAAAGNHQSLGVSLFAGRFADQFPKGKGFPGLNNNSVNPCGRNPQVDRFALGQAHVYPMQPAQQQGGVSP